MGSIQRPLAPAPSETGATNHFCTSTEYVPPNGSRRSCTVRFHTRSALAQLGHVRGVGTTEELPRFSRLTNKRVWLGPRSCEIGE